MTLYIQQIVMTISLLSFLPSCRRFYLTGFSKSSETDASEFIPKNTYFAIHSFVLTLKALTVFPAVSAFSNSLILIFAQLFHKKLPFLSLPLNVNPVKIQAPS